MKKTVFPVLMLIFLASCGDIFSDGIEMERKRKYLYFHDAGSPTRVYRSNFDATGLVCINSSACSSNMQGMALDMKNGHVYFMNSATSMQRMNLDGSGVENFFTTSNCNALAFSAAENCLFYNQSADLHRLDLSNKTSTSLHGFGYVIHHIKVDDIGRRLFIKTASSMIFMWDFSGNVSTVVSTNVDLDGSICYDSCRNILYYSANMSGINYKNLNDGSTGTLFLTGGSVRTMEIDPYMNALYWSDEGSTGLKRVLLESMTIETLISSGNARNLALDP